LRNGKNESNKPTRKAPKSEEVKAAEKTEDVYKRLIKQQQEQIAWEARIPNWLK
jgi:hypothetical protein